MFKEYLTLPSTNGNDNHKEADTAHLVAVVSSLTEAILQLAQAIAQMPSAKEVDTKSAKRSRKAKINEENGKTRWDAEEINLLTTLHNKNVTYATIGKIMGRSEHGIKMAVQRYIYGTVAS